MQWQQHHSQVFVMSDGLPGAVRTNLGKGHANFSIACSVSPRQEVRFQAKYSNTSFDFIGMLTQSRVLHDINIVVLYTLQRLIRIHLWCMYVEITEQELWETTTINFYKSYLFLLLFKQTSLVIELQMHADGPEIVLDLTPKAGGTPFTLQLPAADNFVRDSASPMYPAV